ncbi:hypothetical protein [Azovibrio restrictus]|uniref:hypothetical protein n=1 Tax=Azovibrio restrictus TaxID=146938 RepID=UPI0026E9935D|nr:hypothetical protein [Azovibrio restrictus]
MNTKGFENLAVLSCRRFRGKLHVTEYLDMTTGEIYEAKTINALGIRAVRPEAMLRRQEKLNSLRKEVRQFAVFLLKFRNQLGGFLLPLDQLVKCYGSLEGKEAKHIRRYLPRLVDAGILDFDSKLNPDFMWFDPEVGRVGVRGETFRAYRILDELRLKKKTCIQHLGGHDESLELAA